MDYDLMLSKIVTDKWKKSQIVSTKKLFRGFKFPIFEVKIKNPDKEVIVKIIEDKTFEKRGYLEKNAINLILSKFPDFPVPKIIKFDDSTKMIKSPYIIEEKIPGKDLAEIDISKVKNKKEFVVSLAKYAGQMNSISIDKFGYFDENLKINAISWYDLIIEELTKYIERIENKGYLNKTTINKVKDYIENNKQIMKIRNKPKFIHNDYHGSNIKVKLNDNQCNITGIFDFEICLSGDPIREMYKAEWILNQFPKHKKDFYKEYSKYVRLPKNYKKRLEFYELLGRLKHIQYRKKFETSSEGKKTIKEGIKIINNIIK